MEIVSVVFFIILADMSALVRLNMFIHSFIYLCVQAVGRVTNAVGLSP